MGTADTAHILKMAEIQGGYGVTHIVPTIYPGPLEEMRRGMTAVKEAMELQKAGRRGQGTKGPMELGKPAFGGKPLAPLSVKSAKIIGLHLEGPFLNPARSGALDRTSFLRPTERRVRKLVEGFEDIVRIITIAPELEGSVNLIRRMSTMGIRVSMGHSDATYSEAEAGFHAGAQGITHIFNAMRPIHHREPGIAGFGLLNPHIYVEVIADPFHLHVRTIDLVFKIKNPEYIIIVSDRISETRNTSQGRGIRDKDGTLQGGSMTVTEAAKRLIDLGLPKETVMASISTNPWAYVCA